MTRSIIQDWTKSQVLLKYDDGAIALLSCGVRTSPSHNAVIYGTEGWIEFPESFWNGTKAVLHAGDEKIELRFEPGPLGINIGVRHKEPVFR